MYMHIMSYKLYKVLNETVNKWWQDNSKRISDHFLFKTHSLRNHFLYWVGCICQFVCVSISHWIGNSVKYIHVTLFACQCSLPLLLNSLNSAVDIKSNGNFSFFFSFTVPSWLKGIYSFNIASRGQV